MASAWRFLALLAFLSITTVQAGTISAKPLDCDTFTKCMQGSWTDGNWFILVKGKVASFQKIKNPANVKQSTLICEASGSKIMKGATALSVNSLTKTSQIDWVEATGKRLPVWVRPPPVTTLAPSTPAPTPGPSTTITTTKYWEVGNKEDCTGEQTEWGFCPLSKDCPEPEVIDCTFNDWSEWSSCDCTGLMMHQRTIKKHNNENGVPCDGPLIETAPCKPHCFAEPINCALGDWGDWSGECGSWDAQKTKARDVVQSPLHGGEPCKGALKKTIACGEKPPPPVPTDCEMTKWGKWSACSVTCGVGQKVRTREVETFASDGGKPCTDFMNETAMCNEAECPGIEDCAWEEWSDYSACTCTCGGGQKTRFRGIKNAPKNGGTLCPTESKSEIVPCNTQPCGECIDGEWEDWSKWDECSATCDGGSSMRTRKVKVTANSCGVPVSGLSTEFKECNTEHCNADDHKPCVFAVWSDWSDCSCTCNGVKRRSRAIKTYGTGTGAFCEGPLGEVEPCNIGDEAPKGCLAEPAVDCVMGEWQEWGPCSATCDGGQTMRYREIKTPASGGGAPCTEATAESEGCKTDPCQGPKPVDCTWQDWSDWGACDKCGGQKKRFRHIAQMPENKGDVCDQSGSEETTECPRDCGDKIFCEWEEWGDWSACPGKVCAKYKRERKRILMATTEVPTLTQAKFEDLQVEHNAMKSQRVRDLFVSFACGLLTFAAMLTAVRVFAPKRNTVGRS